MKLSADPPLHLTYCLNVHPGETWDENRAAIEGAALAVKGLVAPSEPFGLGLRLSCEAACALRERAELDRFAAFMAANGLYTFTINGFPYGRFHGKPVKESVYAPDWRARERLEYTRTLADILAALLPDGMTGSISTVPGSYKEWIRNETDVAAIVENLMECVAHLDGVRERTGREIHLGLEPEPDCFIESTRETIDFFAARAFDQGVAYLGRTRGWTPADAEARVRRHLGVCFDACHLAVKFEDLAIGVCRLREAGIRLSKVQISAALRAPVTNEAVAALGDFNDPVYLHQVTVRDADGHLRSFRDLPDFRAVPPESFGEGTECRVHCHVPLYWEGTAVLGSTADAITAAFLRELTAGGETHLEMETYTFNVLPPALRARGLTESLAEEYAWFRARLGRIV